MFGLFLFWISQFKDVFTKRLFFIRIFRVLNTVQSFIFKVQFVALFFSGNFYILSRCFWIVKHFFILFWSFLTSSLFASQRQLLYHIALSLICQQLFYFSLIFFFNQCPFFRGEDYNITPTNKRQALFSLFSDFHVFSVFLYFILKSQIPRLSRSNHCLPQLTRKDFPGSKHKGQRGGTWSMIPVNSYLLIRLTVLPMPVTFECPAPQ